MIKFKKLFLVPICLVLVLIGVLSYVLIKQNFNKNNNNYYNKIKVSVVIPIYNVEKYIRDCLDSVVNQSLKDIEIICIDDGTPDNSGKIADEYAQKDSRIKVIHQENHGLPAARNRGIEQANGEYIKFLDSDDSLVLESCEISYNKAKEQDADILIDNYKNQVIDGPIYELLQAVVWSGMYRTKFIKNNNIKFNENVKAYGEDQSFNLICNSMASKIVCISDSLYNYRTDNSDSITHTPNDTKRNSDSHISNVSYVYENWNSRGVFTKNAEAKINFLKWFCNMNYWKENPEISKKFINSIGSELLAQENISLLPEKYQEYINIMLKY